MRNLLHRYAPAGTDVTNRLEAEGPSRVDRDVDPIPLNTTGLRNEIQD
jgi:hypothetical protein